MSLKKSGLRRTLLTTVHAHRTQSAKKWRCLLALAITSLGGSIGSALGLGFVLLHLLSGRQLIELSHDVAMGTHREHNSIPTSISGSRWAAGCAKGSRIGRSSPLGSRISQLCRLMANPLPWGSRDQVFFSFFQSLAPIIPFCLFAWKLPADLPF